MAGGQGGVWNNGEHIEDQPHDEDFEEANEVPDRNERKKGVASMLLRLREKYGLPSVAVAQMAEEMKQLFEEDTCILKETIMKCLQGADVCIPDELKEVLSKDSEIAKICSELNSQKKLETYVSNTLSYVPLEEYILNEDRNNKSDTVQYVSIEKSIKRLLEFDDIFEEVCRNHRSDHGVRDCLDGTVYKQHPVLSKEQSVPRILYFDEFTITNPLRSQSKRYKVMACYFQVANLPTFMRSNLETICLVSLCKSTLIQKYGLQKTQQFLTN